MLPIYYINLATRPDRRRFMEEQLARLGLVGERVSAATPADISSEDAALYCDPTRADYLRPVELACTLSHERAWRAMLDAGQARALILEDDAELSELLPAFLEEIAEQDVDLIRLESAGRPLRLFPSVATTSGEIALHPFRSTPMGAAAYVLNARAARRLLGHSAFRRAQTDLVLYNPFDEPGASLSRLQAVPALARQLGDGGKWKEAVGRSDIDRLGEKHLYPSEKPLRHAISKLSRAIRTGWRNACDHLANRKHGLQRRSVGFADDA